MKAVELLQMSADIQLKKSQVANIQLKVYLKPMLFFFLSSFWVEWGRIRTPVRYLLMEIEERCEVLDLSK